MWKTVDKKYILVYTLDIMKGQKDLPLEKGNKKRVLVTIDPNVWADIGRYCEANYIKKSALVERLCKEFLEGKK